MSFNTTVLGAQLLKVRSRMGICSRGPKLHAKFMVAVWGIKICALKAPVQWCWSYTILQVPQKLIPIFSFFVVDIFHLFSLSPTKSRCFFLVSEGLYLVTSYHAHMLRWL